MKAVVVYESFWGNTAQIARAIAEGIGPEARALTTSAASEAIAKGVDLLVTGAPLLGFSLATQDMRASLEKSPGNAPAPPDMSQPSMRSFLAELQPSTGRCATFETRIWWSPGSAAKAMMELLEAKGFRRADEPGKFIVSGKYGPMKAGEVDQARAWGSELAAKAGA